VTVLLLLVAAAVWYSRRPPDADQLYQRILANVDKKDLAQVNRAEQDIGQFLQHFEADERAGELASLRKDLQLNRQQRRLKRMMDQPSDTAFSLSPIEQLYLDAMRTHASRVEDVVVELEALVDLFRNSPGPSEKERLCLALAERELNVLRQSVQQVSATHRPLIKQRLDQADQLQATDPEAAQSIRRAIVRVYSDRRWAHDLVQRARDDLERQPTSQAK
jgi:hypothetical protein